MKQGPRADESDICTGGKRRNGDDDGRAESWGRKSVADHSPSTDSAAFACCFCTISLFLGIQLGRNCVYFLMDYLRLGIAPPDLSHLTSGLDLPGLAGGDDCAPVWPPHRSMPRRENPDSRQISRYYRRTLIPMAMHPRPNR